jgi:hypothetical protein
MHSTSGLGPDLLDQGIIGERVAGKNEPAVAAGSAGSGLVGL